MFSLENYKRLQEEINRLITEGGELMEEDESMIELLSQSNNSKGVLGLAKELKEEGNRLFKKRNIDEALEKYGYGGLVLARYDFVQEHDMIECFQLALCILLNSAACFGKKYEYEQVGRICSIILDYEPNNVKALFRRAMAAIGLGRTTWTYWDLLWAIEVEPGNREVSIKLHEVKQSFAKENSNKHTLDETPIGLGSGLSLPRKKAKGNWETEDKGEQKKVQERELELRLDTKQNLPDMSAEKDIGISECSKVSTDHKLNVRMDEVKEVNMEDDKKVSNIEKSNLAEPNYRFVNRRRPGSFLSISKKDYQTLRQGKSIQCFNSRLGSVMTIRVVKDMKDDLRTNGVTQDVNMEASSTYNPSECHEEVSDAMSTSRANSNEEVSAMEPREPIEGNITMEKGAQESAAKNSPIRSHQCKAMRKRILGFSRSHVLGLRGQSCSRLSLLLRDMKAIKNGVGRNNTKCKANVCMLTNLFSDCRLHVGRKRKKLLPPLPCFCNPPRKKHQCFIQVQSVDVGYVASCDNSNVETEIMYVSNVGADDTHDLASFAKMSVAVSLP